MKKRFNNKIFIIFFSLIIILFCSSCNEQNSDLTHISQINITGTGITKCQAYSMLFVPESEVSNVNILGGNHAMIDDEILNEMLEYNADGYVGVKMSAVYDNDIENIIEISGLKSFNFKVLTYVSKYHMYIMTHDLQYYLENKEYSDITKDDRFTIDLSYYLDEEYGPQHYNTESSTYIYREFPDRFSYLKSLDKEFLVKCILGFLLRVLIGVLIAVLLGIAFFEDKKILCRIIIVNIIIQTVADYFVFYGAGDWKFLYLLPITVICMSLIEIIVLLKYRKSEIPHFRGKVYAFSCIANLLTALIGMKLNFVLPHLNW